MDTPVTTDTTDTPDTRPLPNCLPPNPHPHPPSQPVHKYVNCDLRPPDHCPAAAGKQNLSLQVATSGQVTTRGRYQAQAEAAPSCCGQTFVGGRGLPVWILLSNCGSGGRSANIIRRCTRPRTDYHRFPRWDGEGVVVGACLPGGYESQTDTSNRRVAPASGMRPEFDWLQLHSLSLL
ncbi:hypothetical protein C0Q70_10282 [Pomacea canaliculata]|uniref:Uncharacterized protein n=1 Tax=Pomacea canaliculata TaxID=400727 RepID=A0A2T7PC66_POMCA|nr:hypothetical protein C0Q70_10282 [Pomacea canaliculata]